MLSEYLLVRQEAAFWKREIASALENRMEQNNIDFKMVLSKNNERLKEHINAFGNLDIGGCFVFGVNRFKAVGITDEWDPIVNKVTHLAHDTQEPPLEVQPFPFKIKDINLLCLYVYPSQSKPVFIAGRSPLGGNACFKRTGASTIAMSIQEIRDLLSTSSVHHYDAKCLEGTSISDLDFGQLKEILPNIDVENIESGQNIAVLTDNKILCEPKSVPTVTVAGWLIFAKKPQTHRTFKNAFIEFQIFHGKLRDTSIKVQHIAGNLPKQIETSIDLLMQHVWVMPVIQGARRHDIPAYSPEVLREVITNSLVHRDYSKMHQPVKIALFRDRIEIENPGGLMPGLTPLNLVHKRDWRNPLIAELMRKFGYGEMDGQGIDRLYTATNYIKIPAPIIIDNKSSCKVILSGPKSYEEFTPQEKRLTTIILLIIDGAIDNETIRNTFEISTEKATTLIKSLVDEQVIESSTKSRKFAKYILTDLYREKIYD